MSLASTAHALFNECVCALALTAKQLARLQTLLDKYDRPLESIIDRTDRGERLYPLDIICRAAEYGLDGNESKPQTLSMRQQFDYDQMLQVMNSAYDRLLTIARIKNTAERNAALEVFEKELHEISKATESKTRQVLAVLTKKGRSQLFTDKLQAMMMPAIEAAMQVEQKDQFRREFWQLALALRKYHQQHQKYPEQLQQLVRNLLPRFPRISLRANLCIINQTPTDFCFTLLDKIAWITRVLMDLSPLRNHTMIWRSLPLIVAPWLPNRSQYPNN